MSIILPGLNRRSFLASLTALLLPLPAVAGNLPADEFTQRLGTWVVRLAASERDDESLKRDLVKLFAKHVDLDAFVRFTLGKHHRRMSDDMRQAFRHAMLDYVAAMFVRHRRKLMALEVRTRQVIRRGGQVLVKAVIVNHDGTTRPVLWRLAQTSGKFRVVDVNIHNIWLAMRMRERFAAYLSRHGGDMAALLSEIRQHSV